jgi:hypothetical protein
METGSMTRHLTKAFATLCFCLSFVVPMDAQAQEQNKQSFEAFMSDVRLMHVLAMQYCHSHPDIIPTGALAKASKDNDVFEIACMRALDGRRIPSSLPGANWKFVHRDLGTPTDAENMFVMMNGFNLDGKLYHLIVGQRKFTRYVGQANEQSFYIPLAQVLQFDGTGMKQIFKFVDIRTMNWNTPVPAQPDFSKASQELGINLNTIYRVVLKTQLSEAITQIPEAR